MICFGHGCRFHPLLAFARRRTEHPNRHPGGGRDRLVFEWQACLNPKRPQPPPGRRIYRFSVNFLSFSAFFERGIFLKITTPSFVLLRAFAPSCGIGDVTPPCNSPRNPQHLIYAQHHLNHHWRFRPAPPHSGVYSAAWLGELDHHSRRSRRPCDWRDV